jgi:hypothetical protein
VMLYDGLKLNVVYALVFRLEHIARFCLKLGRPVTLSGLSYVLKGLNLPNSDVVVLTTTCKVNFVIG